MASPLRPASSEYFLNLRPEIFEEKILPYLSPTETARCLRLNSKIRNSILTTITREIALIFRTILGESAPIPPAVSICLERRDFKPLSGVLQTALTQIFRGLREEQIPSAPPPVSCFSIDWSIAIAAVVLERTRLPTSFTHLMALTHLIQDSVRRSYALRHVVEFLMGLTPPDFERSLPLIDQITYPIQKSAALAAISKAYLDSDLLKSSRFASQITDVRIRSSAFLKICLAYLQLGFPKTALHFVDQIDVSIDKSKALSAISRFYINPEHQNLPMALYVARLIREEAPKSRLLLEISKAHLETFPPNFIKAENIARLIRSEYERERALSFVFYSYLAANNLDKAREIFSQIPRGPLKDRALIALRSAELASRRSPDEEYDAKRDDGQA